MADREEITASCVAQATRSQWANTRFGPSLTRVPAVLVHTVSSRLISAADRVVP
jgi:hypothetical protein